MAEGIEKALEALELLTLHLGSSPLATEWVAWVPREFNKAADWLATRALDTTSDAWYWHRSWRHFQDSEIVVFSDAGVRVLDDGRVHIGLGWLMVQRATRQVVAAASWTAVEGAGRGAEDVNRWELRAAMAGIGALTFLRAGRVGDVWQGAGVAGSILTAADLRKLRGLVSS